MILLFVQKRGGPKRRKEGIGEEGKRYHTYQVKSCCSSATGNGPSSNCCGRWNPFTFTNARMRKGAVWERSHPMFNDTQKQHDQGGRPGEVDVTSLVSITP